MIVLVSDGSSSDLRTVEDQQRTSDLLNDGEIVVYHVHVGTASAPAVIADLARETGGESFVATDKRGIRRIFEHIDRMRPMDFYFPFALVGLAAIGLNTLGLLGLRYTPW